MAELVADRHVERRLIGTPEMFYPLPGFQPRHDTIGVEFLEANLQKLFRSRKAGLLTDPTPSGGRWQLLNLMNLNSDGFGALIQVLMPILVDYDNITFLDPVATNDVKTFAPPKAGEIHLMVVTPMARLTDHRPGTHPSKCYDRLIDELFSIASAGLFLRNEKAGLDIEWVNGTAMRLRHAADETTCVKIIGRSRFGERRRADSPATWPQKLLARLRDQCGDAAVLPAGEVDDASSNLVEGRRLAIVIGTDDEHAPAWREFLAKNSRIAPSYAFGGEARKPVRAARAPSAAKPST